VVVIGSVDGCKECWRSEDGYRESGSWSAVFRISATADERAELVT